MASFNLYVGADNETGEIDLALIERIVSKRHEGYTIVPSRGIWRGQTEPSAFIVISGATTYDVIDTIADLKTELRQDAIGYQEVKDILFA